jgi:hypothetical protein
MLLLPMNRSAPVPLALNILPSEYPKFIHQISCRCCPGFAGPDSLDISNVGYFSINKNSQIACYLSNETEQSAVVVATQEQDWPQVRQQKFLLHFFPFLTPLAVLILLYCEALELQLRANTNARAVPLHTGTGPPLSQRGAGE